MKSIRVTVIGVIAAAAAFGVVAPASAQTAPRTASVVQTHHHRHCWCDRHGDDRRCRHHRHDHDHGVEAGGGGMASVVTGRTSRIGG